MKKIRGVIDPWTLGFIISIFGGVTAYIVHPPGEQNIVESKTKNTLIESEEILSATKIKSIISIQ